MVYFVYNVTNMYYVEFHAHSVTLHRHDCGKSKKIESYAVTLTLIQSCPKLVVKYSQTLCCDRIS